MDAFFLSVQWKVKKEYEFSNEEWNEKVGHPVIVFKPSPMGLLSGYENVEDVVIADAYEGCGDERFEVCFNIADSTIWMSTADDEDDLFITNVNSFVSTLKFLDDEDQ